MYIPYDTTCMSIPSLYFRIKNTNRLGKAYQPHRDGIHLRLNISMRWYTLDELDAITEDTYNYELNNRRLLSNITPVGKNVERSGSKTTRRRNQVERINTIGRRSD